MADVTLYYELLPYTSADLSALLGAPATVESLAPAPVCVVCDATLQEAVDELMERKGYYPTGPPGGASGPSAFRVEVLDKHRVTAVEYYRVDNGDGTYDGLFRRETNNWQGNSLVSRLVEDFAFDGVTVDRSWTEDFAANSANRTRITKTRS